MPPIKTAAAAAMLAVASFASTSVEAFSLNSSAVEQGTGVLAVSTSPDIFNSAFTYFSTPFEGVVTFTASSVFDFFFTSYTQALAPNSDISAFVLQRIDGGGTEIERYTTEENFCGATAVGNNCNAITRAGNTGGNTAVADTPSVLPYFSSLPVGSYRLTFFDSNNVGTGSATFEASTVAPVPLPAAAPLLLAGLGAFAVFRRRASRPA